MADEFGLNLLRSLAAQSMFSLALLASRDFYGKAYFSLSPTEKLALDRLILDQVQANYAALPDFLKGAPETVQAGFQPPPKAPVD